MARAHTLYHHAVLQKQLLKRSAEKGHLLRYSFLENLHFSKQPIKAVNLFTNYFLSGSRLDPARPSQPCPQSSLRRHPFVSSLPCCSTSFIEEGDGAAASTFQSSGTQPTQRHRHLGTMARTRPRPCELGAARFGGAVRFGLPS
jgi:hypothetical protein